MFPVLLLALFDWVLSDFFYHFSHRSVLFIHSTNLLGFLKTWKEGAKAAYIRKFCFQSKYVSESAETNQVRGMFLL